MLQIDILTVLPELLGGTLEYSIVGRARAQHLVEIGVHWLRDYTHDKRRTVDDYAYGPDAGMVLKPEPIFEAVEHLSEVGGAYDEIIYTAPDGELLTQTLATELSLKKRLLILCGHYKGSAGARSSGDARGEYWRLHSEWWRAGGCRNSR